MELREVPFETIPGWSALELCEAWPAFQLSCQAMASGLPELRRGAPTSDQLVAVADRALQNSATPREIEHYFRSHFQAVEVLSNGESGAGFVTGYYEPEVEGSVVRTREFTAPILSRPIDLIDVRNVRIDGWDGKLEGARRAVNGDLEPYPDRASIEAGAIDSVAMPIVWLRDHVEVFFAQVQGSARVRLVDGRRMRLVYAGRNGRPYSSIGRALIDAGEIDAQEMTLARCKSWLRAAGQDIGDKGRALIQSNQSYVFFRLDEDNGDGAGPIGAQGVPLTPMRSVAVDRSVWAYGLPVWIAADLSSAGLGTGPTGRLMIAQDTGSAIVGPARGDLFIGSGDKAGEIAGLIRHYGRFFVFMPKMS